jgi:hypothetical protein
MNRYVLALSFASCVALAFSAGCSSSSTSSSGGAGGDVNCTVTSGTGASAFEECYSYSNLPTGITATDVCPTGKVSSSACPTANESACCEDISGGAGADTYTYGYCVYKVPSADLSGAQAGCTALKGKWSTK